MRKLIISYFEGVIRILSGMQTCFRKDAAADTCNLLRYRVDCFALSGLHQIGQECCDTGDLSGWEAATGYCQFFQM